MNKFYLDVKTGIIVQTHGQVPIQNRYPIVRFKYLTVYIHPYEPEEKITKVYVDNEYAEIFYTMCREPVKALIYLRHDNLSILMLAEIIVKCKEPVVINVID